MNGIVIGIDPMLAHAGPFMLNWFTASSSHWPSSLAIGSDYARRKGLDPVQTLFRLQEAQVVALAVLVVALPLLSWRLQTARWSLDEQPT